MNRNSVKYLQGINFSQLAPVEDTGITNLGRATPDLVTSQVSLAEYKLTWENLTILYMLNIKGWVAAVERNALWGHPIYHNNASPRPTIRKSHKPPMVPF
jgi:hypothetical protein